MTDNTIDFKSIIELDSELNQIHDLDLLLERILFEARRVVRADAGSIYVKQTITAESKAVEKLAIKYAQNDTIQKTLPPGQKMMYAVFTVPIDEKSISGYCALTGQTVEVPDMYNIPKDLPYSFNPSYDQMTGYKTTSTLTIPLITVGSRLLGVIQVINKIDTDGNVISFSDNDKLIFSHFASNAAVTLQRAYANRAFILRLIKTAELRDPSETGTHVNRVAGFAVDVYDCWAAKNNIPDAERFSFRDNLRVASMLHDIGKVATFYTGGI